MVTYKVVSTQTSYYIISTGGERAGDAVQTRNPHQGYTDADLTFSSPTEGPQQVVVTIKGKAGLYIGYNPEVPIRLIWLPESDPNTQWWVAETGENTNNYRFYPQNGADLYWYISENTVTQADVGLAAGKNLTGNEPLFGLLN
ncbi:hypothetical protein V8E55_002514 [Tylopilus felleus]